MSDDDPDGQSDRPAGGGGEQTELSPEHRSYDGNETPSTETRPDTEADSTDATTTNGAKTTPETEPTDRRFTPDDENAVDGGDGNAVDSNDENAVDSNDENAVDSYDENPVDSHDENAVDGGDVVNDENAANDGDVTDDGTTANGDDVGDDQDTADDESPADAVDTTAHPTDGDGPPPTASVTVDTDTASETGSAGPTEEPEDPDDSQSIEEMLLEFDSQSPLIRDRSLLDPTKIVEEDRIVGRDNQLQQVTKMLRVALGDNRPPNLFLYGPSGTGKSLITKAVCHNIADVCETRDIRFGTIEVNCQDLDTLGVAVYELARRAAEEAGVAVEVPKHGVATKEKWDELYRIVNEEFDSAVFVLDELDMLVGRRDKKEPAFSRLLYQLSRTGSNEEMDAHVSVVAISNDTKMMESVGSRALSSFTPEDVHFDDYDANQLRAILRRRADAFFEDALAEDVIPLASAFAAQTHGDARKAIDLMRVAGELAEREAADRVREEHVRRAQDKVEKNRVLEVIRGISTQKKLCLYATAAVAAATEAGSARSTTGYRVYQFLTDTLDADQYHQETYVNKMKELTTYSLVEFERRSHGPSSGMFLEFRFGERPETVLETLTEDSRLEAVSHEEVETVVAAQLE